MSIFTIPSIYHARWSLCVSRACERMVSILWDAHSVPPEKQRRCVPRSSYRTTTSYATTAVERVAEQKNVVLVYGILLQRDACPPRLHTTYYWTDTRHIEHSHTCAGSARAPATSGAATIRDARGHGVRALARTLCAPAEPRAEAKASLRSGTSRTRARPESMRASSDLRPCTPVTLRPKFATATLIPKVL